ncbi:MAG: transglutaminase-like domain-containing protein [Chloroflexota bacterium]
MAANGLNSSRPTVLSLRTGRIERLAEFGLLIILLSAAIAGITLVLASQDWGTLWRSLFLGLLAGWLLAAFRKSGWATALTVLLAGALYILLFPGGLAGKVADTVIGLVRSLPGLWNYARGGEFDPAPLLALLRELLDAARIVLSRVQGWAAALASRQPDFDPVAASLAWNALAWLAAAWAGWVVEARRNVLLAAVPAVLASVATLSYGNRTPFAIYLMLGCLLLLLALVQQDRRRQFWDETGVAYPSGKGRQVASAALRITLALVLVAASVSSVSLRRIREWVAERGQPETRLDDSLPESLGLEPGENGTGAGEGAASNAFTSARSPGLPQDHLLGAGPELSQRVVMTVEVLNLDFLSLGGASLPLYWRAFTYDIYTGDGWRSSATEETAYEAGQPLRSGPGTGQVLVQQAVYPVEDLGGVVYAAGELLAVDASGEAALRSNGDLFGVRFERRAAYRADSILPSADVPALRAAGQAYPDWIRQRYLALPPNLPDRVRALAVELTAAGRTPYDRALAIEGYLRTYPYSLDVPRPPADRDVVDYFLFDLKTGYCDYYASAMVVLARAAGLPARLAVGYASGAYNLNSGRFVVTEADAHSWVEVYFPETGWVTFEPTAGRPPLGREDVQAPAPPPEPGPSLPPSAGMLPQVGRALLAGLVLIGLLGLAWAGLGELRLARLPGEAAAIEIYRRLRRFGRSVGVSPAPGATPYEFVSALRERLGELSLRGGGPVSMPRLLRSLGALGDGIVLALYRPSTPGPARSSGLVRRWRRLRRDLWRLWLLVQWRTVKTFFAGFASSR